MAPFIHPARLYGPHAIVSPTRFTDGTYSPQRVMRVKGWPHPSDTLKEVR